MTTANRDSLLKLLNLVRPALSTQSFIPALTHILFDGVGATAFNDVTAIRVDVPLDIKACVPGENLIKALASFNSETVSVLPGGSEMMISSGRAKLKLPALAATDFPFTGPTAKDEYDPVPLTDEVLEAIKKCLPNVGTDPTHPAQMGVTLDQSDGKAVLFSTDNHTISRCATKSKIDLPGGTPIILPTFFCDQMLSLSRAFPNDPVDLQVYAGALRVTFGKKAWVFTRTLDDVNPLDMPMIISKYLDIDKLGKDSVPIPETFDAAWQRALLVLATEADKSTEISEDNIGIRMFSRSALGEVEDLLEYPQHAFVPSKAFYVDPALVIRGSKQCARIALYDKAFCMTSGDGLFMHMIAHCAA